MVGDDDGGTGGELGEGPEFARDTRVVDFGQAAPVAELLGEFARADPLPADKTVRFRTIKGPGQDRVSEMTRPAVVLGRVNGIADIVVDDEAASRYHACITHRDGKFLLIDMGSTNGTFVNRRPIAQHELEPGDKIRIGITVLEFEVVPRQGARR